MRDIRLLQMKDPEAVADKIGDFIVKEILKRKQSGAVIGLSGGVDSTVTAALAKRAIDKYNRSTGLDLVLKGFSLPSEPSLLPSGNSDVSVIGNTLLDIEFEEHNLANVIEAYRQIATPALRTNSFHMGNLISRARAVYLNSEAAVLNCILLGTGNRDEDFGLGYYTLFGDGAVHISPIGGLPKRLVREMAEYLGFGWVAKKEPTAGLEPGQTDFKDLGYSYETAELILEAIDQRIDPTDSNDIWDSSERDLRKEEELFGKHKFEVLEDIIDDVLRRHKIADEKAMLVNPPKPDLSDVLEYR